MTQLAAVFREQNSKRKESGKTQVASGKGNIADVLEQLEDVPNWREELAGMMFISVSKVYSIANGVTRTPAIVAEFISKAQMLLSNTTNHPQQ